MHNNDNTQNTSSDSTPSQMNGDVSDSTPSQMNGNASDSTPSKIRGEKANIDEEVKQDDGRGENSQISDSGLIADSGLIEDTEPVVEQPKADYQLLYTTAYHQIYSIVGEGRRYILKAIKPSAGDLRRQESLLKREYALLSQLECPYIVRVWKLRNDPKVGLAIVMEYVDGLQLDQWLKTKPTKAQKQQILSELLEAIQYLHNKQMVHSDLKPQNILVAGNHVKLLDVGFSDKDEFIQSNIGYTPTYAAPEQIKGGTTDSRTDIYAIGALIRLLFPHDYCLIVRRCMRTNPQKRYASIADIQQAMHATSIGKRIGGILCLVLLLIGSLILLFTPQIGSSDTAEAPVSDTMFVSAPDTVFIPMQQENTSPAQPIIRRDTIIQRVADSIATTTVIQHDTTFIVDSTFARMQKEAEIAEARHKEWENNEAETDSLFNILEKQYMSAYYRWEKACKNKPYANYPEIADMIAEFFALDIRYITGQYAKQHPNDHNPDHRFGKVYVMLYQTESETSTRRVAWQAMGKTAPDSVLNRASQLRDSLNTYRRKVDSFFSEEDFLNYAKFLKKTNGKS